MPVSLLISVVLLVELPLHGPRPGRAGLLWAAAQLAAALGAFGLEPSFSIALVLAAVVIGSGAALPRSWALAAGGVAIAGCALAMTAFGSSERVSQPLLPVVTLHALAMAVGRLAALRIEERRAHEATVAELKEAEARLVHGGDR